MQGAPQIASRWCKTHGGVAAVRNSSVWGCGDLVLVLISFGLWVPVRLILTAASNPWRCPQCGKRV